MGGECSHFGTSLGSKAIRLNYSRYSQPELKASLGASAVESLRITRAPSVAFYPIPEQLDFDILGDGMQLFIKIYFPMYCRYSIYEICMWGVSAFHQRIYICIHSFRNLSRMKHH